MTFMKPGYRPALFVAAMICGLQVAAQSSGGWQHFRENDQLHAAQIDRFVLAGHYLTPPRSGGPELGPLLVVQCIGGKVSGNYFAVGAVVNEDKGNLFPVMMEARFDGKPTLIGGDAVSTDGTGVFFPRADLANLLKHRIATIGVNEFLGPEVVMQFQIPEPVEILAACSADKILSRAFKGSSELSNAAPPLLPAEVRNALAVNSEASKSSPAAAAGVAAAGRQLTPDEIAARVRTGAASPCGVVTDPPGAEIEIDGNRAGVSPLAFVLSSHGDTPRVITIKLAGYQTVEQRVNPDGKTIPIGVSLKKLPQ